MENNFTVDTNSTEIVKTLEVVLGFALCILFVTYCFMRTIYERYQSTHESPHNSTLSTISAVSSTEITNNSTRVQQLPPVPILILKVIVFILWYLILMHLELLILHSARNKFTHESPHNSTLSTISADSNTEITNNSTRVQEFLPFIALILSNLIVISVIVLYDVLLKIYIQRKEFTHESPHNSTLSTISADSNRRAEEKE
ncbi:uncharacterized protein LOC110839336 [Zootermopsis nevadensis]|uniref:uncharacterized protein LOC110839336 n=1 Tax=Zootermopsis nevadensis TaxID=136037 RepID=UPI000B8EC4C4|nr:uncharacterized protein LOC110839336 [Zootermopsis nevadensis]XP_021939137.1 uncharacterized protein LOC110839336 [Zootermopsis nevadensis]